MSIDNRSTLGRHPTPEHQQEPPAGWVKMPRGLVGRVSPTAVAVALALGEYANASGECFPTYKTLGQKTKLHRNTVRKAVTELVEAGLVEVEHRRRTAGKGGEVSPGSKPSTSNLITLLWMVERCTVDSALSGGGAPPAVQGGAPPTRDRTRTTRTKKTTTTERRVVDLENEKQQRDRRKVLKAGARLQAKANEAATGRKIEDPGAYVAGIISNWVEDGTYAEKLAEIDQYRKQFPDLAADALAEKIHADRPAVNRELPKRPRSSTENLDADQYLERVQQQSRFGPELTAAGGAP